MNLRRPQYSLFVMITFMTLLCVTLAWWRNSCEVFPSKTEMTRAREAIQHDHMLSSSEKHLYTNIVMDASSWRSGLVNELRLDRRYSSFGLRVKRIVWRSKSVLGDRSIVLVHDLLRNTPPYESPLTCLVTDERNRVVYWQRVADKSIRFQAAQVFVDQDARCCLSITAMNWFAGPGEFVYRVQSDKLIEVDRPTWVWPN